MGIVTRCILQFAPALAILFVVAMRRAERRLVGRLREAGATVAERAVALGGERAVAALKLWRLTRAGAVREATPGRYYLDGARYATYREARRRRAVVLIGVALAAAASVYLWQGRS